MFQAINQKVLSVMNEDQSALTENLPIKNIQNIAFSQLQDDDPVRQEVQNRIYKINSNNGQALVKYLDQLDQEEKLALYRWDHQVPLPAGIAKATLGSRGMPKNPNDLD